MNGKTIAVLWLSLVMIFGLNVIIIELTTPVSGAIIYVDDDYVSENATHKKTIQAAIDVAKHGDTVYVYNGAYYENVVVNKTINLTGENRENTIIDGNNTGDVVNIAANWVNITGFTLTGGGPDYGDVGVELDSVSHCNVSWNNVTDNFGGIVLIGSSSHNLISHNNIFSHFWDAISLEDSCHNNTLLNNYIFSNNRNGISLEYNPYNNTITGNNISFNSRGINLFGASGNRITDNYLYFNSGLGIYLSSSSFNFVAANNIMNHSSGIQISSQSEGNIVAANNISGSRGYGIYISAVPYHNEVIENNLLYGRSHGINLYKSSNHNITANNVSWNNEAGFYLTQSDDNRINGNIVLNNKEGIHLRDCFTNHIFNNTFFSSSDYGMYIKTSYENSLCYNNVSQNRIGVWFYESYANNFTNNEISSNNREGLYLGFSTAINVTENTMVEDGILIIGNSIDHWDSHAIDISNTVNGKPVYYWKDQVNTTIPHGAGQVILVNCTNITIENQNLTLGTVGIQTAFSSCNTIRNNNVSTNDLDGIHLYQSDGNEISGNTVSSNYWDGIYLDSSYGNNIIGNAVLDNWYGICFIGYGGNNVTCNNISLNNEYGIILWGSSDNNIVANEFYFNNLAIRILSSYDNNIYFNNFISNTGQAIDNTDDGNNWDKEYPYGGNFWSDYIGNDAFKGPLQNIPGSDGIGDTDYSIDADTTDNYPLMEPYTYKPFENYIILKQGWNMISIPFIQDIQGLYKVLEMIDGYYDAVRWHERTDSNDPWKHNRVGKPFGNDLFHLNESMGFWIHITNPGDTIFLYNGTQPTSNQSITIHPGWNMVGYPSLSNRTRDNALNNIIFDQDVDAIWTFNAATQTWQEIGLTDYFELGRGYWVHSKVTKVWDVPL